MKRLFPIAGLGVILALALASPSLAAKPKKATPAPADTSPVVTPDATDAPNGAGAPAGTVQSAPVGTSAAAPSPYTIPVGGAHASTAAAVAQPQAAAAPPPPPPPPAGPPVMARAEQCLNTNLARVIHAEPSAKLAVDLLLIDVCGEEVDAASQYVRNIDALAQYNPASERGRAGLSTAHVDPETGQIVAPPNVDVSAAVEAAGQGDLEIAASLRKYAADLVLTEKERPAAPTPHPATPAKPIPAKASPAKKPN